MRRRISDKQRKKVIILSAAVCVALVLALIIFMYSLTRDVLNNDDIRANVELIFAKPYDAETVSELFDEAPDALLDVSPKNEDMYIAEIRYAFYNYSGGDVYDYSVEMSSLEEGMKVYATTDMETHSESDRIYVGTNYVVLDKALLDEKYIRTDEPLDFKAPVQVKISYDKKGEIGRKSLSFSIKEREDTP